MVTPMQQVTREFTNPTAATPSGSSQVRTSRFDEIRREQNGPSRVQSACRQIANTINRFGPSILRGLGILIASAAAAGVFIAGLVAVDLLFTTAGLPICGAIATGLITAFVIAKLCSR
jgi:hypothetical protein